MTKVMYLAKTNPNRDKRKLQEIDVLPEHEWQKVQKILHAAQ